jgi:hypothetical protein
MTADAAHPTTDSTWHIAIPDSISIEDVEWRLTDPAGKVIFEAKGMARTR